MTSRHVKSIDTAMLQRMPSRSGAASLTSRYTVTEKPKTPRSQRYARFARHTPRHLRPQQTDFKIRTSVADLVLKELDSYDRCIFYQRVYILTKNILLTVEAESSSDSILSKYMRSKASLTSAEAPMEVEPEEIMGESEMEEMLQEADTANVDTTLPIEAKSSQEDYSRSLLKITRADIAAPPKEKRFQELNFFDQFKTRIEEIVRQVESDQLSEDRFSGLLLCMGNSHSLIVLEGTEDTIANFCQELLNISNEYFDVMRVFMVEDRISETYFDEFIYRRAAAMNITEKFPPPTANDPYLMGPQHWLIKEKLQTICRTLSYELKPVSSKSLDVAPQTTSIIVEEEKKEPKKRRVIKRKKSPRRKKEKTTRLSKSESVSEAAQRKLQEGSVDMASVRSEAKLSVVSATSMHRGSQVEHETVEPVTEQPEDIPETASVAAVTVLAPPMTAVEEETTIAKETSVAKLNTFASFMAEKDTGTVEPDEEEDFEPREIFSEFTMSPTIYNRLLPEVQRIELVLTSKRFYLDVIDFLRFSQQIPMQADEDAVLWPTHYNYMPLNVFQRMPFDVNLTFGSYDAKEETDESSSEDEEKEAEEGVEEEKKPEVEG